MSDLYPELAGYVIPADALMDYVFAHHQHADDTDGTAFVNSVPLEKWLRDNARKENHRG